jgi:hypothetical protein
MLISNPLKRLQKMHAKRYQQQSDRKMEFFTDYNSFPSITFLGELSCTFLNGFKLSIDFSVL